jgi:lipopolysaccharide export system protein LptA
VLGTGLRTIALAALAASALAVIPVAVQNAAAQDTGTQAKAAQAKGPFGGFKHDSSAPIEIASDSLEVQEAKHLAIFAGNVDAVQGTLHLTADRLDVTYAAEQGSSGTGAIQHMRAEGNVFLSNASETAQGAWAEYDVAGGTMRMGGNVVLTQGDNAISGQSLFINLNAGTGKIEGGTSTRVKSVFTPAPKKSTP